MLDACIGSASHIRRDRRRGPLSAGKLRGPKYIHTYIHTYIERMYMYTYIYDYMCHRLLTSAALSSSAICS